MSTVFKGRMCGFATLIEKLPDGCLSIMQASKEDDNLDDAHYPVDQVVMDDDVLRDLLGGVATACGTA